MPTLMSINEVCDRCGRTHVIENVTTEAMLARVDEQRHIQATVNVIQEFLDGLTDNKFPALMVIGQDRKISFLSQICDQDQAKRKSCVSRVGELLKDIFLPSKKLPGADE